MSFKLLISVCLVVIILDGLESMFILINTAVACTAVVWRRCRLKFVMYTGFYGCSNIAEIESAFLDVLFLPWLLRIIV